jgi:hypothetical protein
LQVEEYDLKKAGDNGFLFNLEGKDSTLLRKVGGGLLAYLMAPRCIVHIRDVFETVVDFICLHYP